MAAPSLGLPAMSFLWVTVLRPALLPCLEVPLLQEALWDCQA